MHFISPQGRTLGCQSAPFSWYLPFNLQPPASRMSRPVRATAWSCILLGSTGTRSSSCRCPGSGSLHTLQQLSGPGRDCSARGQSSRGQDSLKQLTSSVVTYIFLWRMNVCMTCTYEWMYDCMYYLHVFFVFLEFASMYMKRENVEMANNELYPAFGS